MVAHQCPGSLIDMLHNGIKYPGRVRPITDQVSEKSILRDLALPGMRQAGFQRFAIGVQVSKKGDQHGAGILVMKFSV